MRWLTAGESHGQALVGIIEGVPAGVEICGETISVALERRRLGYGRGARMGFEKDSLRILSGVRHGIALGSPIALEIENTEWPKWEKTMSASPLASGLLKEKGRNAPLTRPRPGHADFTGMQKYGFNEARPVLERASARETAMRVALGVVAAAMLEALGVKAVSHTVAIADVRSAGRRGLPRPEDAGALDRNPVRCFDPDSARKMVTAIDDAKKDGQTLGGVVEVAAYGVPPGIGSYAHWDRRLDSRLAGALMGIQAIKGVEIGDGFATAERPGSAAHDEMRMSGEAIVRETNRAGGMSTGDVIRVRAAMKPIATVPRALRTVDVATGEPALAHHQRSDVCAVPAAGVVAEAMVNLVLAQLLQEKFGGDSIEEMKRNVEGYLEAIPVRLKSKANPSL